jgi:hypothetical protein
VPQIKAVFESAGRMSCVGQTESGQIWNVQSPAASADDVGRACSTPRRNVAERTGTRIAEVRCVRRGSDAEGIQYRYDGSRHAGFDYNGSRTHASQPFKSGVPPCKDLLLILCLGFAAGNGD